MIYILLKIFYFSKFSQFNQEVCCYIETGTSNAVCDFLIEGEEYEVSIQKE